MLFYGDDDFRRRKSLRKLVVGLREQGWRVTNVDGEDHGRLAKLLLGSSFFQAQTLVLVENPDKVNLDLVLKQKDKPSKRTVLLLHCPGKYHLMKS